MVDFYTCCTNGNRNKFVEPGAKINGQYYRQVMLTQHLLPTMSHIAGNMFIFQQDSAPAHRARETIELLSRDTPDFIGPAVRCGRPTHQILIRWTIPSGLSWSSAYTRSTDELRQCLLTVWNELGQQIIDNAVDQWRDRLAACVREEGGHFEHTL